MGVYIVPQVNALQFHHFVKYLCRKRVVKYGLFKTFPVQVSSCTLVIAHPVEHPEEMSALRAFLLFEHRVHHDVYDRKILGVDRPRVIEVHR